jgi:tRNA A37 threonylcarbamoyladenosine synthetase subunit TsaC/SUA5/YrdC
MLTTYNLANIKSGGAYEEEMVLRAAAEVALGGLLLLDNVAVYAVVGSATNPGLQEQIRRAKGEGRGVTQPVGWTVPFDEVSQGAIDLGRVTEPRLQELLRDQDELTSRLGAIAFLRAPARPAEQLGLSESIIAPSKKTVQIWSPSGNRITKNLIRQIRELRGEPVMTSANISGTPEAVTLDSALDFAGLSAPPLPVVARTTDELCLAQPKGSYPVIAVQGSELVIVRSGCFAPEILQALCDGYPIRVADREQLQSPNYPDGVLLPEHLPAEARSLNGSELRLAILEHMGVT